MALIKHKYMSKTELKDTKPMLYVVRHPISNTPFMN